jgi:15-cis-phytoene synthase
MSEAGAEQQAAAFCADLVRAQDFDRYATTLFVGSPERRALLALYAFNVEIARVRFQVSQPLPGEIRLQWWTDMLTGSGHGGIEGNPVAFELKEAIATYALPIEPLTGMIEAHLFDLYNDPMPDSRVLEAHLTDTEGALFGAAGRVLGANGEAVERLAGHAAMAHGLARAIARLPYDSSRRQMYLPKDVLERHGCDLEQVFAGTPSPALRAALDELIAVASKHLDMAMPLIAAAPHAARRAFLPLALTKCDLDGLARPTRNPFAPCERMRLATLWTLWRASRNTPFR